MTNTNHKLLLLLCGHFLLSRVFGELLEPDYVMQRFKCDLQCHNNGVCSHLTTNEDQLRKRMQSGQMIQQCDCPRGYRGMSCDVSVDEFPCPKENAGRLRSDCDCAVADQVSAFAGEQCRNPSTEYCASLSKSIGGHIFFCSHGGKCNGDIIAAQLNPGNTSSNYLYQ